ncbi:hypothetical protein NP439_17190 [Oceanobacillus jeddahense]|uniref:Outer spore coat protein CotE n=1 Tax=Oceanobacillus jeddahense TaxID=1462527 RepID=A0ABY5JN88_9BACI|nr:hypothetical protein [Oceanobacillus jeddahense]UUI01770.1 hypothetical protein NP439_17190 [Oceanobacillus jeddahense]
MVDDVTFVLFLTACGDEEESSAEGEEEDIANNESSQEETSNDIMPLSEGLEEYCSWFKVSNVVRDARVEGFSVFENGEVTVCYFDPYPNLEDVLELSDDEIIELANESKTRNLGEYVLEITPDDNGQNVDIIDIRTVVEGGGAKAIRVYPPQPMFDTTLAGFEVEVTSFLVTRVDESFNGFELDSLDTDKENITIK